MKIEWRLPARMFAQQLPSGEQAKLMYKVESLKQGSEAGGAQAGRGSSIILSNGKNQKSRIYQIRAEPNLRILYTIEDDKIIILDVFRKNQIDKLRSIIRDRA
jgi:hypothetical protein